MRIFILILSLSFGAYASAGEGEFLRAINMVESSGREGNIIGDHGRAKGGFQIHKEFWLDAVGYDKSLGGKYSDVTNNVYARRVVLAYLRRYAPKALARNDYRQMAFTFHRGENNEEYWRKVKKALDSQ